MKSRKEINQEAEEIYFAIKQTMEKMGTDYCQSWWINTRNFNLKSHLPTSTINQRCRLLIKQGYLIKNQSLTATHTGTSYKLTDKAFIKSKGE